MTIRRILGAALLGSSLLSASVVAVLVFLYGRQILLTHIEAQLRQRAVQIAEQIDMTLFERLANMATWSRLRVMEELRVQDVDKRLSAFLRDLHQGYGGVYRVLAATDLDGRVVAASDPHWLGRRLQVGTVRRRLVLGGRAIEVMSVAADGLTFRARITDALGEPLGWLYAVMDRGELRRFLLQSTAEGGSQIALLADGDGRVLAASRAAAEEGTLSRILEPVGNDGIRLYRFTPLEDARMVAGIARSQGWRGFPGFGWRVVLMVPAAEILAPLQRLWVSLAVFLLAALGASGVLSYALANRISRPLSQLTAAVRRCREQGVLAVPPIRGSREVAELGAAFAELMADLERSRRDLVQVSKLAVVGEMAAIMAHEVRTPLGILRSSAEMLQRDEQLSPISREMTDFILSETERLGNLVNTLLECARPRPPRFCIASPGPLIGQVQSLLRTRLTRRQVTLTVEIDDDDGSVECDPDHLVQVLLNLVVNALQHVPEKGHILIRSRLDSQRWRVWVCDDGPGIPPEWRERVFDPFFTRREGGIGLGLTVVQQIVRAHHGGVEVVDGPLAGACVHFWLPREQRHD